MRPPGEPFKVLFGSADHNANSPLSAPTSHLKLGLFSLPQELSFWSSKLSFLHLPQFFFLFCPKKLIYAISPWSKRLYSSILPNIADFSFDSPSYYSVTKNPQHQILCSKSEKPSFTLTWKYSEGVTGYPVIQNYIDILSSVKMLSW